MLCYKKQNPNGALREGATDIQAMTIWLFHGVLSTLIFGRMSLSRAPTTVTCMYSSTLLRHTFQAYRQSLILPSN